LKPNYQRQNGLSIISPAPKLPTKGGQRLRPNRHLRQLPLLCPRCGGTIKVIAFITDSSEFFV
jgi:hypothetical protein